MKPILFAVGLMLSASVLADDRPEAPADLVAELKAYCEEVASEDGTNGQPLDEYLLECVNAELESEGYKPVKSLN